MASREGAPVTARLGQRKWPSIPDGPLVLVPVGSTEQHGPHLPLDTDTVIASAVADGIAQRIRLDRPDAGVLVAPAVPFGASGEHQSFPGTVSIGHFALRVVLIELVRSLSTWAGPVVFVNGHGGNVPTLVRAVSQLTAEHRDVGWVPCWAPGSDAHAGRTETSLMLHLAPAAVDLSRAVPGNRAPLSELMPRLASGGVRAVSASGVLGDPAGAGAAEGRALLEEMVSDAVRRLGAGEFAAGFGDAADGDLPSPRRDGAGVVVDPRTGGPGR